MIAQIVARDTATILAVGVPMGSMVALAGAGLVANVLFGFAPTDSTTVVIASD